MKRRDFILLSIAWVAGLSRESRIVQAQQTGPRRIGFLMFESSDNLPTVQGAKAFRDGLRERGYASPRELEVIEGRVRGPYEELLKAATELVRQKVEIIVCTGTPETTAAMKATSAIPIVFLSAGDPVSAGLVKSLAYPGGNVTGITNLGGELVAKQVDVLLSVVPKPGVIGVLINPDNPNHRNPVSDTVRSQAAKLGVTLVVAAARSAEQLPSAFSEFSQRGARALIVRADGILNSNAVAISALALKNRLPAVAARPHHVDAGLLSSYAPNLDDLFRRGAYYVERILKGAKPAELPVEQPRNYELHVNLRTAKTLGITVPQSLLVQATRLVE